jgi:hypothetical protein
MEEMMKTKWSVRVWVGSGIEAALEWRTDNARGEERFADVSTLGCREVGFIEKHGQISKLV